MFQHEKKHSFVKKIQPKPRSNTWRCMLTFRSMHRLIAARGYFEICAVDDQGRAGCFEVYVGYKSTAHCRSFA